MKEEIELKVGFTGTRNGMSEQQKADIKEWLESSAPSEAHHGDCVGADAEFHEICEELGISIVIHPPSDPKLRAFCFALYNKPEKPYLDRNRDIVDAVDVMLATPASVKKSRGGTWYTINYSLKSGKSTVVFDP